MQKPSEHKVTRGFFSQLVKQLTGYLYGQGSKFGAAQLYHLFKDGHMLRNFAYWIGLELHTDMLEEFDKLKLFTKDNIENICRRLLKNISGSHWCTCDKAKHMQLF